MTLDLFGSWHFMVSVESQLELFKASSGNLMRKTLDHPQANSLVDMSQNTTLVGVLPRIESRWGPGQVGLLAARPCFRSPETQMDLAAFVNVVR